jgi:DNA-binding CsgD family transcriptional regulator
LRSASAELTARQFECLRLYALQDSQREVARELGLSPITVKKHVNAAYAVLGVSNAIEAFRALGWLRVPEP